MPRAFLKKKNRGGHHVYKCTVCGEPIQTGDQYYTWKFNRGGRYWQHASHGHPKRSQLSSSKMGEVWDAVDTLDLSSCESGEDIKSMLEEVAAAANSVAEQYTESADSIESSWPAGNPTSEACRATAEALEGWAQELESWDPDSDEPGEGETAEEYLESLISSAQDIISNEPSYEG